MDKVRGKDVFSELDVTKMSVNEIMKLDAMAYARTLSLSKKPSEYPKPVQEFLAVLENEVVKRKLLTPLKDEPDFIPDGHTSISAQDSLRRLALAAQALYLCKCEKNAYSIDPVRKPGFSDVLSKEACEKIIDISESISKKYKLRPSRNRNQKPIIDGGKKIDPWKISEEGPNRDDGEARDGNRYSGARGGPTL